MANVKFGMLQIGKPTPAGINKSVTIVSIVLGVFLLWMNSDQNLIPDGAAHVLNSLGGLAISLINALKPFFGVQVSDNASIPAVDVDVMNSKGDRPPVKPPTP